MVDLDVYRYVIFGEAKMNGIFYVLVLILSIRYEVYGQCTFTSTFASTSWHDNTKGTLTFTTTTMSGWSFQSFLTTVTSTISSWQCVNNTDDNYMLLRTVSTFPIQSGASTSNVYAYLCMKLTKISDVSYYYYQQQVQQVNTLGGERLKVSTLTTLNLAEACDTVATIPTLEFHVLVKSGSESLAAMRCPASLLFSADYKYISTSGTEECTGSSDVWDTCTNETEMTFDYTKCSQQIMFSAGGRLWCIFTLQSGYDYTVVYNQDSTITTGLNRFACLAVEDPYVSVAPGNCTATQHPFDFPKQPDGTTSIGHRLIIGSKYVDCDVQSSSTGLSPGAIAAIVISVLYFMFMITMFTIFVILLGIFIALVLLILLIIVPELPNLKGLRPLNTTTLSDLDLEHPKIVVTTPSEVNPKMTNGVFNKDLKKNGLHQSLLRQKSRSNLDTKTLSQPNIAMNPVSKLPPIKDKVPLTSRT